MKFSLIALAGALTAANAAASAVPKTFKLNGKRNLRRGDASTEALLQKAVPYNRKNINRHLQEEEDDNAAEAEQREEANEEAAADEEEEAAVEPSSTSTISFHQCVDVKTKDENLFSEDLIDQVQAGNIMSLKSYVIFNVCNNDTYGYGCSNSDYVEYMVDLSTYLSVVGLKQANKRTDYCEQCNRYAESCGYEAYEDEAVDEEQEGEEVEQEGEEEQEQEQEGEEAKDEQEQEQEQEGSKDEQEGEEAKDEQEQEQEQEQEGSKDEQEGEEEGEEEGSKDEQEGEEEREQEQGEQEQEGSKDQQEGEQEQGEQEFEEEKDQQDAQAYQMTNGGRKLKEQINCNKCESYQCFADDGQADIDTMVAEWIAEVVSCKATDQYVNGMQVYLGPICSDGKYFEIGAFLNEDCTIHTNLVSFSEIATGEQANYDVDVAGYAISALKQAVYEPMKCKSQEKADVNEEEEKENEEEENEMNDYCKQLFEGEQTVKFSDCAAAEEEEQEEEQEEEADEDYSWYSYDLEAADDLEETCAKVVSFNGEYARYYDSSVNGTIHENESSVFGTIAIVVACVAAVGLVAHSLTQKKKKNSPVLLEEHIYQGGRMS